MQGDGTQTFTVAGSALRYKLKQLDESLGSSLCNYCKSQFPFHHLDDNAFKIVLYEFQHGTISYGIDHLETLFLIPFLTNIQPSVILKVTLTLM